MLVWMLCVVVAAVVAVVGLVEFLKVLHQNSKLFFLQANVKQPSLVHFSQTGNALQSSQK